MTSTVAQTAALVDLLVRERIDTGCSSPIRPAFSTTARPEIMWLSSRENVT
jgi:hypothetical protein